MALRREAELLRAICDTLDCPLGRSSWRKRKDDERHVCKFRPIRAAIRHIVRNDEMVLGLHRDLNIVADDP
jgi:hypothetical protein